jgi:uncharacterized protein YjiS (DUF1127 family)
MLFESEWPGDTIVLPVGVTDDREDEMFIGLGDGSCSPTEIRPGQSGEDPALCDLAKSAQPRRWISPLFSILGELRSRMQRRREIQRINAAWAMVDDRMLKDIGIARLEVEYARDARWG